MFYHALPTFQAEQFAAGRNSGEREEAPQLIEQPLERLVSHKGREAIAQVPPFQLQCTR